MDENMKRLTLYTDSAGYELAEIERNFWATTTSIPNDLVFTIDEDDVRSINISHSLYEIESFDSIKWITNKSFTEWFEEAQGQEWHEDFGLLYKYADEMLDLYDKWCEENNQEPNYNG